jgi:hypothetical protein
MGHIRAAEISQILKDGGRDATVLAVQVILSLLTVGAPIWMAWLSTKQIGHSFRLSEDYGFKAAVAKAYEGFRDEAIRLDPQFEARLFSSALQRLDENPLRLVSDSQAGSPMQELIEQPWFQDAIKVVPGFRDQFLDFLKGILKRDPPRGVEIKDSVSKTQPIAEPAPSK